MTEPAGPSQTARRVAAYRLGFERVAAPASGDPDADDRLTADVAAGVTVDPPARWGCVARLLIQPGELASIQGWRHRVNPPSDRSPPTTARRSYPIAVGDRWS